LTALFIYRYTRSRFKILDLTKTGCAFWRMLVIILILSLPGTYNILHAQSDHKSLATINTIVERYYKHTDTLYLQQHKNQIIHSENSTHSEELQIVYDILMANAIASTIDSINHHSNQLYEKNIKKLEEGEETGLLIWANIQYGIYYYNFRNLSKARPYIVKALHLAEKTPHHLVPLPARSFKQIAYFLVTLGENSTAIEYFKIAEKFAEPNSEDLGDILNSIGRCFFQLEDYSLAESYFNKALQTSIKSGDHIRQAKIWGDIGLLFQHNQNYEKAEEAFLKDISLSDRYDNPQNTMFAYTLLAKLYLTTNKLHQAENALEEAYEIAKSNPYYKVNKYQILKLRIEVAQKFNNNQEELYARRRLDQLENELLQLDGDQVVRQVNLEAQKEILNLTLQAEHHKRKHDVYLRNTIILFAIVAILALILFFIAYRKRNKLRATMYENKVMKLQLENVTSENKLNATRKTLNNYREYLVERNNQIEALEQEIEKISKSSFAVPDANKRKLQELLQSHLMSESNWLAFKAAFAEEEPEYYQYILEYFTDLTDSNLRILFLQKLGFNNPKTAQILGITLEAVKKNKQRMRKKYGLAYTQYLMQQKLEEDECIKI
jgi:tetratricopeptide (TPR) repeat protein